MICRILPDPIVFSLLEPRRVPAYVCILFPSPPDNNANQKPVTGEHRDNQYQEWIVNTRGCMIFGSILGSDDYEHDMASRYCVHSTQRERRNDEGEKL